MRHSRGLIRCTLLATSLSCLSASAATTFGPTGLVPAAKQVFMSFADEVVAFGDTRAPDPARVQCAGTKVEAKGRWLDNRRWVAEFAEPLADGVRCSVTPLPLTDLKGRSVALPSAWEFNTGGPKIRTSYPIQVNEYPVRVFETTAAVDPSSLRHLRCSINGSEAAVAIPEGNAAAQARANLLPAYPVVSSVVARCGEAPLPNDAEVIWTWDRKIASVAGVSNGEDEQVKLRVRPAFTVKGQCTQQLTVPGCDPRHGLSVRFSTPVRLSLAKLLTWRDEQGKTYLPEPSQWTSQSEDSEIRDVGFAGPFAPGASLSLVLPPSLADIEGRKPSIRARAEPPFRIAQLAPYVGMERRSATLAWTPGVKAAWPVASRGSKSTLDVRGWQFGSATPTAVLMALHETADPPETERVYKALPTQLPAYFHSEAILASLHAKVPAPQQRRLAPPRAALNMVAAPLAGYGNWLLEGDSVAYRDAFAAQREALLTREQEPAAVTISPNNNGALLWDGQPVDSAALEAKLRSFAAADQNRRSLIRFVRPAPGYVSSLDRAIDIANELGLHFDITGELALVQHTMEMDWSNSRSALVQLTNLNVHASLSERGQSLIWVSAFDTARALANASVELVAGSSHAHRILLTAKTDSLGRVFVPHTVLAQSRDRRNALLETIWVVVRSGADVAVLRKPYEGQYHYHDGVQVHTVLDRALYHPGETVSMAHVKRAPALDGWIVPEEGNKAVLSIRHADSYTKVFEQAVLWGADGSAQNSWTMPADARLGHYRVELEEQSEPRVNHHVTEFQVEQFRVPTFDAALALETRWAGQQQALRVTPSLSFLAGGAVAGHSVSVSGTFKRGAAAPLAGYSFVDLDRPWQDDAPLPATTLTLDAEGRAQLELQPPKFDVPMTLLAEMQFADASGETHTHPAHIALWPARHKLGIVAGRGADPSDVMVSVVALDEHDTPLAGELLTVDAADLTARWAVCTVKTDAEGKGQCRTTWHAPGGDSMRAMFRVRADGAATASSLLYPPTPYQHGKTMSAPAIALAGRELPMAGQDLRLRIRAPFLPATMVLSLEREGVLTTQTHYLTQASEEFTIKTEPGFAPGVSAVATFVRATKGLAQADEPEKLERTERLAVMFNPAGKRLLVDVTPETASARPGAKVAVNIKVRHPLGTSLPAGASVTLIAVDDGLALLKPNLTTKVAEAYWLDRGFDTSPAWLAQQWLQHPFTGPRPDYIAPVEKDVAMFGPPQFRNNQFWLGLFHRGPETINRIAVVREAPLASSPLGRSGMAAGPALPVIPPRINFSTLALWQAHVVLDEHGEARVAVPLPDSLTRWRIVAIASAGADLFGNGESVVSASKPVEMISGLPLSVRGGDLVYQKITVRNTTPGPLTLALEVSARMQPHPDLPPRPAGKALGHAQTVTLAGGASTVITWPFAVPDGIVGLDWTMTLTDKASGVMADALALHQAVVLQAPLTVRESTLLPVLGSKPMTVAPIPEALPGAGAVRIDWQDSLASAAIGGARAWAAANPHACFEQRSSVAAILGDGERWNQVMATLERHMEEGLVRFFPSTPGSESLTAYLLALARAYELPIPEAERGQMQAALREVLTRPKGSATKDWLPSGEDLNFRLFLQAALGPDQGAIAPTMPAALDTLPTAVLLDWASFVLDNRGLPQRAEHLQQAAAQLRNRYEMHGGHLVWRLGHERSFWMMWPDDALAARTALLLARWQAETPIWADELALLGRAAAGAQHEGRWSTTVSNALNVAALRKLSPGEGGAVVSGISTASLLGQSQSTAWPAKASVRLPLPATANGVLTLAHAGTGAPWAAVSLLASVKLAAPVAHGLAIEKTITAVERRVAGRWSVGDVFKVTLVMHSDTDLGWLAMQDPIPSGATILGKGLAREGQLVQDKANLPGWWQPGAIERGSDSFRAYYERIWKGRWSTDYLVRLNNAGTFHLPATRIEAMYAPEVFGETPNPSIEVLP